MVTTFHREVPLETMPFSGHNDDGPSWFLAEGVSAPMTDGLHIDLPKKTTGRLPRSATKVLKRWFALHSSQPYPTEQEKQMLQEQTHLSARQVSNWFANARRRYPVGSVDKTALPSSLPVRASMSTPNLATTTMWQNMNPLDRWRNSPPDQEPAPLEAIVAAARDSPGLGDSNDQIGTGSFDIPQHSVRAYSDVSFDSMSSARTSQSSTSADSANSSGSNASNSNLGHFHTFARRRRRRPLKQFQHPLRPPQKENKQRLFQCTFCTDTFASKYDWTRHESTLHLLLEKWVCAPHGPIYFDGLPRCVFCDAPNPTTSHLQSHNYDDCVAKPAASRVFGRKDHLRQHLRLVHHVDCMPTSMDAWKSQITSVNCRCGFCGERFVVWSERNDHIAEHFREGTSMKEWKGCRGLDPGIALLVENAMPPYLIGFEKLAFEPFSASRIVTRGGGHQEPVRKVPTAFESLTARLGDYVMRAMKQGIAVTDETVRREARMIMFGDDDAWNQTPADNPEWLRLFKDGLRLNSAPVVPPIGFGQSIGPSSEMPDDMQARVLAGSDARFPTSVSNLLPSTETTSACGRTTTESGWLSTYIDAHNMDLQTGLPLSWQTPECLAEFSVMSSTEGCSIARNLCSNSANDLTWGLAQPVVNPESDGLGGLPHTAARGVCPPNQVRPPSYSAAYGTGYSEWTSIDDLDFPFDLNLSER